MVLLWFKNLVFQMQWIVLPLELQYSWCNSPLISFSKTRLTFSSVAVLDVCPCVLSNVYRSLWWGAQWKFWPKPSVCRRSPVFSNRYAGNSQIEKVLFDVCWYFIGPRSCSISREYFCDSNTTRIIIGKTVLTPCCLPFGHCPPMGERTFLCGAYRNSIGTRGNFQSFYKDF